MAYLCSSTPLPRHIDVGTVLASRYELQGLLGRGGMGLVFKALDHTLGEVVALKVLLPAIDLSPEILKRFRSEAKLARRVRHRNVCAILGYEEDGDVPFIVMELVLGTDLKRHLQKIGAMEWEDGFEVSLQVTEGLAAIHEAGVIHRDLKPANITRDEKGIVRVMDFGIAKGGTHAGLTDDGKVVCTIDYVSPEQLMSKDIDPRSDIYSFGIVIYELFTGRVPFRGDTPAATMRKHLEEPPPLHGAAGDLIPRSLVPVLERALAKDREDRFPDAQALGQALQQAREAMHRQGTDPVGSGDRPRDGGSPARRGVSGPYPAEAFLLVPTLARAIASPDRAVRVGALEALARTPDESAREALTAALADPEHEVRERAAEVLRRLTARPEPRKRAAPPIAPQSAEAPPSAPVRAGPDRFGTSSMEEALRETSDVDVAVPENPTPPTAPSRPRPPTPPPAPEPPVPRPPPSPPRFQPPAPSPGVSRWPYWLVGALLAVLIVYALLQRDTPAPIVDRMSMLPSPSPSASATPEPPQVPPSIPPPTPPPITRPIPTPTVPPPTPTPRPPTPPPPTTTTLAPPTTTMPPTPLPTPEPPPTTVPPTLPPTPPPTLSPTPAPSAAAPVEASDPGITRPVCAKCPPPQLPLIAQDPRYWSKLRESGGVVELQLLVDESGRVADVKRLKGDRALANAAINAVRTWRYTPAVKQGVNVRIWLVVALQFSPPTR